MRFRKQFETVQMSDELRAILADISAAQEKISAAQEKCQTASVGLSGVTWSLEFGQAELDKAMMHLWDVAKRQEMPA